MDSEIRIGKNEGRWQGTMETRAMANKRQDEAVTRERVQIALESIESVWKECIQILRPSSDLTQSMDYVKTFIEDVGIEMCKEERAANEEVAPPDIFKVGDVVMLNSGSPHMTVVGLGGKDFVPMGSVRCGWFDGQTEHFTLKPQETLRKVEVCPAPIPITVTPEQAKEPPSPVEDRWKFLD